MENKMSEADTKWLNELLDLPADKVKELDQFGLKILDQFKKEVQKGQMLVKASQELQQKLSGVQVDIQAVSGAVGSLGRLLLEARVKPEEGKPEKKKKAKASIPPEQIQ